MERQNKLNLEALNKRLYRLDYLRNRNLNSKDVLYFLRANESLVDDLNLNYLQHPENYTIAYIPSVDTMLVRYQENVEAIKVILPCTKNAFNEIVGEVLTPYGLYDRRPGYIIINAEGTNAFEPVRRFRPRRLFFFERSDSRFTFGKDSKNPYTYIVQDALGLLNEAWDNTTQPSPRLTVNYPIT